MLTDVLSGNFQGLVDQKEFVVYGEWDCSFLGFFFVFVLAVTLAVGSRCSLCAMVGYVVEVMDDPVVQVSPSSIS